MFARSETGLSPGIRGLVFVLAGPNSAENDVVEAGVRRNVIGSRRSVWRQGIISRMHSREEGREEAQAEQVKQRTCGITGEDKTVQLSRVDRLGRAQESSLPRILVD